MNKLLVICGQTATGKTSLALKLAEKLDGELVSADSRQVYKGMDIGTGKDIPKDFEFRISNLGFKNFETGYYASGKTRLWGYDLVDPKDEFNVSDYTKIARRIIGDIWKRGRLPILVGGTGLYIKAVVDGIGTSGVGKDESLRKKLSVKNTVELFALLTGLDPVKASLLNESDRKNPRRLIRAIEIAKSESIGTDIGLRYELEADTLFIGLKASREDLVKRIEKRVSRRFEEGILEELEMLLEEGVSWNDPAMTATGYRQLRDFVNNKMTIDESFKEWINSEIQYAKRQLTWFNKNKRIYWFDAFEKECKEAIEKIAMRWYLRK